MRLPQWINKIGVELEGVFPSNKVRQGYIQDNGLFHYDGSVCFSAREIAIVEQILEEDVNDNNEDSSVITTPSTEYTVGEVVSPPMRTWQSLSSFVKQWFPILTNSSCGTHFHLSFKNAVAYAIIFDEATEIQKALQQSLVSWGRDNLPARRFSTLTRRLEGRNEFCKAANYDDPMRHGLPDDRYTMINFCSLERHHTIEFRLLPGFENATQFLSALELCLEVLHTFINPKYEVTTIANIQIEELDTKGEEHEIEIKPIGDHDRVSIDYANLEEYYTLFNFESPLVSIVYNDLLVDGEDTSSNVRNSLVNLRLSYFNSYLVGAY